MSILGAIVRTLPAAVPATRERLAALPGVEVALDPGDGRLIVLLEDGAQAPLGTPAAAAAAPDPAAAVRTAAETLAAIALWPEVLNTSLVYEYSGPDVPAAPVAHGTLAPAAAGGMHRTH